MTLLGLDYEALCTIKPELIYTSVSSFGKTGPYRDRRSSDIAFMAMSGLMNITGDQDRAPLRFGLDQSYCLAGTQAAIGTLFALFNRHSTGEGQHVDVSCYESLVLANYWEPVRWEFEKRLVNRLGDRFSRGKGSTRQVWPCKDGYVTWTMMGGRVEIERLKAIVEKMDQEGMAGFLKTIDLDNVHISQLTDEEIGTWEDLIGAFFLRHTKEELNKLSKEKNLTLCFVNDLLEVMDCDQFAQRKYWEDVEIPEMGIVLKSPGFLFKSSEMNTQVRFRAPRIGEHNNEIYEEEMGLTEERINELKGLMAI
jgi:crotonobetainyl-CoA:carnitine CoA-transferase CaiB-like acyl-CoA transferase